MKGRFRRIVLASAMILVAGSLAISEVRAEGSLEVNDSKLDSFVDAYRAVHAVASESMERIQAVKNDQKIIPFLIDMSFVVHGVER